MLHFDFRHGPTWLVTASEFGQLVATGVEAWSPRWDLQLVPCRAMLHRILFQSWDMLRRCAGQPKACTDLPRLDCSAHVRCLAFRRMSNFPVPCRPHHTKHCQWGRGWFSAAGAGRCTMLIYFVASIWRDFQDVPSVYSMRGGACEALASSGQELLRQSSSQLLKEWQYLSWAFFSPKSSCLHAFACIFPL